MADIEKKENQIETASKKPAPAKKSGEGFGSKIVRFFKDCKSELKKIVWYGKKQTLKSTLLVIIAIVLSGAIIGVLDLGFSKAIMALGNLI